MNLNAARKEFRKLEKRIVSFQGRAANASVKDVKAAKVKVTALARKLGYKTATHLVEVLFGESSRRTAKAHRRAVKPAVRAKTRKVAKPAARAAKRAGTSRSIKAAA